jgi:hypothetical protein
MCVLDRAATHVSVVIVFPGHLTPAEQDGKECAAAHFVWHIKGIFTGKSWFQTPILLTLR